MKCEAVHDKMLDFLEGSLEKSGQKMMEAHLETCSGCQEELATLDMLQNRMKEVHVPEPSEEMHENFYTMLDHYKADRIEKNSYWSGWTEKVRRLWYAQRFPSVAYTILILAAGIIIGLMVSPEKEYDQQMVALNSEVQQMREMMLLTLLKQPSATDRLKAVNMTSNLGAADERVVEALLKTLNTDPNVNVRLVAAEALAAMASYPEVRQGLIRSISLQESPIVQIALADIMVVLQEKRSVDTLRKMLKEKPLDDVVKGKFEETIDILT